MSIASLRAEVARLREAMERIAARAPAAKAMNAQPGVEYWCTVAENRLQIARAALGDGEVATPQDAFGEHLENGAVP